MRGGEIGGIKKEADTAIAAIRNAREMLGEGPRFKDVDATAINAGDAPQSMKSHILQPSVHSNLQASDLWQPFSPC